MNTTTSGLKQTRAGEFYMLARDEVTQELKELLIELKDTHEVFDLRQQHGHYWRWNEERQSFVADKCGKADCRACGD